MTVEDAYREAARYLGGFCERRTERADAKHVVFDMSMGFDCANGPIDSGMLEQYKQFVVRVCEAVVCSSYESGVENWSQDDDGGPLFVDFWTPSQGSWTLFRVVFHIELGDTFGYGFPGELFEGDALFNVIVANIPRAVLEFERGNLEFFED